jgi:hypothetical protein
MPSFIFYTLHQISLGRSNQGGTDEPDMYGRTCMGEMRNAYEILVGEP